MSDHEQDNLLEQEQEVVALQSIYPDQFQYDELRRICTVSLPQAHNALVELTICLPATYPSHTMPSVSMHAPHMTDTARVALVNSLTNHFVPGQVVLFTWLDHLLTNPDTWTLDTTTATNTCDTNCTDTPLPTDTHHHHHHNSSPSPATPHTSVPAIVHGQPITERKSTFQAHVASVHSVEDVQSVMQALLAVNKIRAATHNIMAYRIQHPGTQLLMQDCDDDGEDAAGGRLLHLLQVTNACNVCVVVTRWYGGVLLGPSRFALINNTARHLLEQEGFIGGKGGGESGKGERKRG